MSEDKKKIMNYQEWDLMQKHLQALSDMLLAGKITDKEHEELRSQVMNGTGTANSAKLP